MFLHSSDKKILPFTSKTLPHHQNSHDKSWRLQILLWRNKQNPLLVFEKIKTKFLHQTPGEKKKTFRKPINHVEKKSFKNSTLSLSLGPQATNESSAAEKSSGRYLRRASRIARVKRVCIFSVTPVKAFCSRDTCALRCSVIKIYPR